MLHCDTATKPGFVSEGRVVCHHSSVSHSSWTHTYEGLFSLYTMLMISKVFKRQTSNQRCPQSNSSPMTLLWPLRPHAGRGLVPVGTLLGSCIQSEGHCKSMQHWSDWSPSYCDEPWMGGGLHPRRKPGHWMSLMRLNTPGSCVCTHSVTVSAVHR